MSDDIKRLRALLERLELSQRAAAMQLDIDERSMRRYCAGDREIPRLVFLALERLVDMKTCAYCGERE
jgi:plasmid maintenance system antidote protein VapI